MYAPRRLSTKYHKNADDDNNNPLVKSFFSRNLSKSSSWKTNTALARNKNMLLTASRIKRKWAIN